MTLIVLLLLLLSALLIVNVLFHVRQEDAELGARFAFQEQFC